MSEKPPVVIEAIPTRRNKADVTRRLNDTFHRTFVGGKVVVTPGVRALDLSQRRALFEAVRAFDGFEPENDPYGEHDFGSLQQDGERYFWKIDYYDRALSNASPDPSDTTVTTRVLTIMRADEY